MTADYFACLKALNVTGVDKFPKATEYVPVMVEMIARLVETGYAYPAGGDVYFDVAKDADYGKLCGFDPEQLEAGSRVEASDKKRNPGDFALWKGAKPGEPPEVQFDSPWGKGRPGWHIECSAMSRALLGETLDIHGGGLDLRFPHHENELAQSESATGKPFARIWMHNGLLSLGQKMAGSLGNVLNVADALKHVSGEVLRFFILQTHYRSPIDISDWKPNEGMAIPPGLEAAKRGYDTFLRFAERVQRVTGRPFADPGPGADRDPGTTLSMTHVGYIRRFRDHMDDDFNTGGAIGVLFELVTALNKVADQGRLEDPSKADPAAKAEFAEGAGVVRENAEVLGLTFAAPPAALGGGDDLVAGLMGLLIDLRANIRTLAKGIADKADPTKKALFDQTDLIRKRLADLGVTLEDRPGGTTWRVG
jgi:cysteinyl-tRNA synthetase